MRGKTGLLLAVLWAALPMVVVNCGGATSSPSNNNTTTYDISGTVTSTGTGLQGVTMTLSGAGSAAAMTDSSGNFSLANLASGSYTITPSKVGFSFNPTSSEQIVTNANVTDVIFTASIVPTYSISGTVTSSGTGLQGVTMTLSGAGLATASTDASGNFSIANLASGSYTITPNKVGFSFNPTSSEQIVTITDVTDVLFTAITATTPYTDNGNGTINANTTGLVWQKQVAGITSRPWDAAVSYCQSLSLAGSNWRLPTLDELKTLVDMTQTPTIDPIFINTRLDSYWSSTSSPSNPAGAWTVDFSFGFESFHYKTVNGYVRCVR